MEIAQDLLHNGSFINGRWQRSPKNYQVSDPATEKIVAEVAYAGKAETEEAIEAAAQAFKSWRHTIAEQRSQILYRWSELIKERSQDLARLLTYEQGKPLSESLGEVLYSARFLDWFAQEARRNYGDIIPSHKAGSKILVNKEPIGVVAAITPWNFPYAMVTRKLAPALAAGCSVVLKPSEETPLSALALAELASQAQLPAGMFNVVSGDTAAIGAALMNSELVRKVSFTGSTRVGKLLMRQAAEHIKKLSLELGGNASFIVFNDADIQEAIKGALFAKYRNTGQTCVSVNRFYIHENIYEQFVEQLSQEVSRLKLANGFTEGATQGPLINKAAHDKVCHYVEDAYSKGAEKLIGGASSSLGANFYQPTVLTNTNQSMSLAHEEVFGPVAACYRFSDEEEVVARANKTASGLASYFYTRDLARIWRVSEALEVGMVGVNDAHISTEVAPFGGVKESGLGREGSKYGLDDYQEIKYTLLTI